MISSPLPLFLPLLLSPLLFTHSAATTASAQYEPNWQSLDTRPLPAWYDEAKIGIFIHWGVYSVPSFGTPLPPGASGEWFWWAIDGKDDVDPILAYQQFFNATTPQGFTYPDYVSDFTAYFYNATEWVSMFQDAGARYVVLTTKHHEGFCLWPSETSFNWNAMDVGPHRDLVGEFAEAVAAAPGLHLGLYHSLFEWFNPLFLADQAANYATNTFVTQRTMPELYDLINRYKPDLLWSDGDWFGPTDSGDCDLYWGSCDFIAWLANDSPVKENIVWNDRWGGTMCKHGSFFTCADRYLPTVPPAHKWENAFTLDLYSWGYRRNMKYSDVMTTDALIQTIAQTVALGGNALVNVGATSDGRIPLIFQDRLAGMGTWLRVNGEAIYATSPWRAQNDSDATVWYTSTASAVYAIATQLPTNTITLVLSNPISTSSTSVSMLGATGAIRWAPLSKVGSPGIVVSFPTSGALPCQHAWVFKLEGVH